jgi:hypothetical protein
LEEILYTSDYVDQGGKPRVYACIFPEGDPNAKRVKALRVYPYDSRLKLLSEVGNTVEYLDDDEDYNDKDPSDARAKVALGRVLKKQIQDGVDVVFFEAAVYSKEFFETGKIPLPSLR